MSLGITHENTNQLYDTDNIKSFKDAPEFTINPFTDNFTLKKKVHYSKTDITVSVDEKEINNEVLKPVKLVLAEKLYKDNEPFCRFFVNQEFVDISKLSPQASKLFLYIALEKTNFNLDFIVINIKIIAKEFNITLPTIYSSITELIKSKLIAKKADEDSIYWINPYVFFRGDRRKIRFRKI